MKSTAKLIKESCYIFFILFLIITPLIWVSLFFTSYHGDLTRIGKWLEADFGWQMEQSNIPSELLESSEINQADILVIGDSFSESLNWQSILTYSNHKVTTLTWSQIGGICEDFPSKLKYSGFKGKKIIIQSVERTTDRQLKSSIDCKFSKSIPKNTSRASIPTPTTIDLNLKFNIKGQFIAGLETIFHTMAIKASPRYALIHNYGSKGTQIHQIKNGCDYFSNELCKFGLFFHEDYEQPNLGPKTLQKIENIHKRLNAYKVSWIIVPNKSSIYQREVSEQFWVNLSNNGLGPNLYNIMHRNKSKIRDMYYPNDTHLSTAGYLFLGREIKNWIDYF